MKRADAFNNQWDLVHCGMQAVRATSRRPEIWINSAIAVNLHPEHRLPFPEWCKKIAPLMTASDSFDLVVQNNTDPYHLLPLLWQAMLPCDKRMAMSIFESHGKMWNVECVREMMSTLLVTVKEMSALQLGVWHAIDDPSHLDRGMEDADVSHTSPLPSEVTEAEAARHKATHDLPAFTFKPDGMTGKELLDHFVSHRLRKYAKNQKEVSSHPQPRHD